jgi:hypothetical protein
MWHRRYCSRCSAPRAVLPGLPCSRNLQLHTPFCSTQPNRHNRMRQRKQPVGCGAEVDHDTLPCLPTYKRREPWFRPYYSTSKPLFADERVHRRHHFALPRTVFAVMFLLSYLSVVSDLLRGPSFKSQHDPGPRHQTGATVRGDRVSIDSRRASATRPSFCSLGCSYPAE